MKGQTILMVGATSSLAQALCRTLAKRGCNLILAGRDAEELAMLAGDLATRYKAHGRVLAANLTDAHFSVDILIRQAGHFDHAIIAVGDMGNGDDTDPANIAAVAHINYILPAQIATAAAMYLSEQRRGTLAIISSVAGDRGRQSNIAYGSAKAALSAFASGLRNRYVRRDVHVMTVKPGFVDTPMTWGMQSPLIANREYVAEKIVSAMLKKKDLLYVPWFWQFIMLIICHIPEGIFKKLKL